MNAPLDKLRDAANLSIHLVPVGIGDTLYALLNSAASASASWFSSTVHAVSVAVPALGGFTAGFQKG